MFQCARRKLLKKYLDYDCQIVIARYTSIKVGKPFNYNELLRKLRKKLGEETTDGLDHRCLDKQLAELAMEIVDET